MPSSPRSNGSRELDPDLSPETSPDHPERVASPVGTRRINQKPMLIVFVLVSLFAVVCIGVMYSRSQRQIQRPDGGEHTSASRQADSLIPKGSAWTPTAPEVRLPPRPALMAAAPLPTPPPVPMPPPAPDPAEAARLQALQAALSSKPVVEGVPSAPRTTAGAGAGDRPDPEAQRLAALRALFGHDGQQDRPGAAPAALPVSARADISGLGQFDAAVAQRWRSNATIENPGRFTLRTGAVIPGVLISGVNSDLPGTIIAQVSQNVYDTPTGSYLLLPQGSRLIGAYSANVAYGQSRVFIAWQRVIYPDGRALDIGAQPGTDGGGYAGFADKVDNHYPRIFGSALLMSAIVGGVAFSQQLGQNTPNFNDGNGDGRLSNSAYSQNGLTQALSQSLGVTFGNVITNLIQKNLNISPTLKIRPGYRFNILVVKDFELTPYEDFQFSQTESRTPPRTLNPISTTNPSPFDK